ncbi:MAG: AbrB/MazE/SpoVT family DNA-binding domain-containing protein [Bacteriodetes bacterium]|nr:AbrB/MazE/SpoVT family DNA-binding domain-containing protein [Bacteroidota bacterium]
MNTSTITRNGYITIPKKLRDKYGIKPGGTVGITELNEHLTLTPLTREYFHQFVGTLDTTTDLTKIILDERKKDDNN